MAKVSNQPLQPNPFLTYRDPDTGQWLVLEVRSAPEEAESSSKESAKTPS